MNSFAQSVLGCVSRRRRIGAIAAAGGALALILSGAALADQSGDVKRLAGVNSAICKPALKSGADMQKWFATRQADVNAILAAAGWNGNSDDLYKAVQAGQFKEVSVPVGTQFKWMGMREKKQIVAKPNRRWAGKKPFAAYEVDVVSKGAKHKFLVPKPCCNLALVSSEAPPPPPPPPAPAAPAPTPAPAAAPAPAKAGPALFLAPFIGVIERNFPDPLLLGLGAGVLYPLNPGWDLLLQIGAGNDDEHSHTATFAEIGALKKIGNGFLGGGIGVWDIASDDLRDGTIWLEGGLNVAKWTSASMQWFVNGRVFWDELDNISDNFTLSTGLRVLFGGK